MSWFHKSCLLLVAASLFLFGGYLVYLQKQSALALEQELLQTKAELEELHIDHRDTMDAITQAIDLRKVLHEQAKLTERRKNQEVKP